MKKSQFLSIQIHRENSDLLDIPKDEDPVEEGVHFFTVRSRAREDREDQEIEKLKVTLVESHYLYLETACSLLQPFFPLRSNSRAQP